MLFTIGYEGLSIDEYVYLLTSNDVKVLVDVRRNASSRKPGFSKTKFSKAMNDNGLEYVHMSELGTLSDQRKGVVSREDRERLLEFYEEVQLKRSKSELDQLCFLLEKHKRIAISCFEEDVVMCHRGRIAKVLCARSDWKWEVRHL